MSSKSQDIGSPVTEGELLHPEYYEPSEDEDTSSGVAFLEVPQPSSETVAQEKPEIVLDVESQTKKPKARRSPKLLAWIIVNILATIGIVFVNKAIFDDPSFRNAQLSFASFHFFVTFGTLHVVSLPRFGFFERRRARLIDILPLAGAMCLNVILPNLSLAYSSVTFYQTVRVLLTPIVAALNYLLYQMTIPRQAAYTLVPVCLGVAMVTYYDVQPGATEKPTSFLGVFFAMTGVVASSIYTVWIAYFHKKLEITSVQLLHNQSLVGAVMLLYAIPLIDTLPIFSEVALNKWLMIFMVSSRAIS